MLSAPKREEINHCTIKLIVGLIALSLGALTDLLADHPITSISASYWEDGWARNILVGFLFAIAAFLLAYNGQSRREMILSKVAAFAALGIALFPCECDSHHPETVPCVHGTSAAVMFLILTYFCYVFYCRAREKGHAQAKVRTCIYAACGISILAAIATLMVDYFSGKWISSKIVRLTFYGECTGLVAFGVSWLTASHWLPVINSRKERFKPFNGKSSS
jgi:hypothetical protein